MNPIRVLFTGDSDWSDDDAIRQAFLAELLNYPIHNSAVLVHAAELVGAERHANEIWAEWAQRYINMFEAPERHAVSSDSSNRGATLEQLRGIRDLAMVSLGADVCIAAVTTWGSDAGDCARLARKARIRTIDLGVSTAVEDRPEVKAA